MKILIYGLNFKPENVGIGKYTGELADFLHNKKHKIKVICSPKYYPNWKTSINKYHIENTSFFPIYRCPIYVPKSPGGLKRLFHLFTFSLTSFPILLSQLFWKPHVIIVVAPTLFCAFNAIIFRLLYSKKLLTILHIQDFELDAAFNLEILKGKVYRNIFSNIELAIYRNFSVVSSISKMMVDLLVLKGIDKKRTYYFPNWVDVKKFKAKKINDNSENIYRKKLKIPSKTIVIQYSGSISRKQGLNFLLPIIKNFKDNKNVLWLFGGEGPLKKEFMNLTKKITNIKFLPIQESKNMDDWLNTGDIHIIPQKEEVQDIVFPSKLLAILASGSPVVSNTSSKSELGRIVKYAGIQVEPKDTIGFENALRILIKDEKLRFQLGEKGRKVAFKEYDKYLILNKFENFLIKKFKDL